MIRVMLAASLSISVAASACAAAEQLPRLAGTVIGPSSRQALIELGTQQHGLAEGEDVAGWMVESIAAGHVVLIGPDGPISLWIGARAPAVSDAVTEWRTFSWNNPCGRLHGAIGRHDGTACRAAMAAAGLP